MDTLKCYVCRRTQPKSEFQHFKSCQTCRKKRASKKEVDKPLSIETEPIHTITSTSTPTPTVSIQTLDAITESTNIIEIHPIQWIHVSKRWIKKGEERALHTRLMKRLNRQFFHQSAFPVHKYLTKYVMVDIRDL